MNRTIYIVRQAAYTLFSFAYFLLMATALTLAGFFLLTLGKRSEANKRKYHRLLQQQARFVINRVPGTTFEFDNSEAADFSSPAVIICNHQSHLDLMAIMMLTPDLVILTKSWVWHNPFYGLVIRYADYLPVSDQAEMMDRIADRVANGYSVVVFPEGTRSADCRIGRFHRGAFKMAEDLGLDIQPMFISGFGKVLPKTSWHLHPGQMAMQSLPRLRHDDPMWKEQGYRGVAKYMHKMYQEKNGEVCCHR